MKNAILAAAALASVLAFGDGNKSADAVTTLLNTRTASSAAGYEAAAKIVAKDAAEGKVLQRLLVAILSRENDAPAPLRIDAAKRKEYLDSSLDKIRLMAEKRQNPLAYYLLAMESDDIDLLKKAADAGNVQAMNAYATMSLNRAMSGNATPEVAEKAMKDGYEYFSKAAEQGDANSLYNLGMCYMRGYSVAPDPERARECFFFAARKEHPEAINNVGGFYRDGITVERDPVKAARWFAKSADLGNAYGELNYALALLRGEGVVQDEERAVRMLRSSAQHGNVEAMNALASCLHHGVGAKQDVNAAIRLYRKAADGGLAAAMDNYADCFENGEGLPQNQEAANVWRMKARAARGDHAAAEWLRQSSVK